MEQKLVPTKKNKKLTTEDRIKIVELYKVSPSKKTAKNIAIKYGIDVSYVYKLVKKNELMQKEKNLVSLGDATFNQKTRKIINLILDKMYKQILDDDKVNLTQLATTLGVLYDKTRLEEGSSTQNKSININIHVDD